MKFILLLSLYSISLFAQEGIDNLSEVLKSERVMRQKFKFSVSINVREFKNGKFKKTKAISLIKEKGIYYTGFTRRDAPHIDEENPAAYVLENGTEMPITSYSGGSIKNYSLCTYRYTSFDYSSIIKSSLENKREELIDVLGNDDYETVKTNLNIKIESPGNQLRKLTFGFPVNSRDWDDGRQRISVANEQRKEIYLNVSIDPIHFLGCGWKAIK